jgi:hypothetical protein
MQVINDLLDPTGQNLRVREDAQVKSLESFIDIVNCQIVLTERFNCNISKLILLLFLDLSFYSELLSNAVCHVPLV